MAKKRKEPKAKRSFRITIVGEPAPEIILAAQMRLLGATPAQIGRARAKYRERAAEYETEDYEELKSIDYAARVPLHHSKVVTTAGSWRIEVEQIQSSPVGRGLMRYGVVTFVPPVAGIAGRRVGMWLRRRVLRRKGHVAALKRTIAAWLEDDGTWEEGEYIFDDGSVSEYTPVGANLIDGLLGRAGAIAKLSRDPELRSRGEGWLKGRERTAYPFSAKFSEAEFERHWARVKDGRLHNHASELVNAYEATGREQQLTG